MRGPDTEVSAAEKVRPATSLFAERDEEEVKATVEPDEREEEPRGTQLSEEGEKRKERLMEGPSPAGEDKSLPLPEGKSALLFAGAAAVAVLVVAVGVALALRRK